MSRSGSDFGERLTRLLSIVPWLLARERASVAEIAQRFSVDEAVVLRDLELVGLCGVPPYGGGDLIDVIVDDDGWVSAFPGPFFSRPMRLTPAEGFALLAAARALVDVPGAADTGALRGAVAKLEAALGEDGRLAVELEPPEHLDAVRRAVEGGERLAVRYYSAGRDELTERRIDPRVVYSLDGRWYVDAHCHTAGGLRRFRVDRFWSLSPTGEHFPPEPVEPPGEAFTPGPDVRPAVLRLPAPARWVADAYPVREVAGLDDGAIRVVLDVAATAWLERVLLQAGPDAEVLEPDDLRGVAAAAAKRVLARYES